MGNWLTSGNLTSVRYQHGLAGTISAAVAFASGATGVKHTSETFNGTTWAAAADLNGGDNSRTNGCGTQSAALMAGGLTRLPRTEKFNGTSWSASGDLNEGRDDHALNGGQTAALIAGGDSASSGATDATEVFDGTSWAASHTLTVGMRFHASAGSQTSALLAAGSQADGTTNVATTQSYNGTSWSARTDVSVARRQLGGCGDNSSSVLVFGGFTSDYSAITERWNGTSWSTDSNLPIAKNAWDGAGNFTEGLSAGGVNGALSTQIYTSYAVIAPTVQASAFSQLTPHIPTIIAAAVQLAEFSALHAALTGIPEIVSANVLTAEFSVLAPGVQIVLIPPDVLTAEFSVLAPTMAISVTITPDIQTLVFSVPSTVVIAKELLISVNGFPSNKTVSYRVVDDSGNIVQNWTSLGVNERVVDVTANKSIYYLTTKLISGGFQGHVEWKTNDATPLTAAQEISYLDTLAVTVIDKLNTNASAIEAIPTTPLLAADYTAPDNAGIAAIQAKTDNLPADPASQASVDRLLGLCLENHVEDDIVRDGAGNKLSSVIYLYDSAASVATHVSGGGTGLLEKYNVTATYSANRLTLFKVVKV